jgi:putative membrane protein
MWQSGDGMGWWMVIGSVWMVIFWVAIAWLFLRFFARDEGPATGTGEAAIEIARRRYAAGDISREQYEQMRHDLQT